MNIDHAIRKSPYFTLRNFIILVLGIVAITLAIFIAARSNSRATVCDRATADDSLWAQGPEAQAGRQACSQFHEAQMIPCTVANQNQTAFCVQSPHGLDSKYPDEARTVFAYRPERGEHGELLLIGEYLHDDIIFY